MEADRIAEAKVQQEAELQAARLAEKVKAEQEAAELEAARLAEKVKAEQEAKLEAVRLAE